MIELLEVKVSVFLTVGWLRKNFEKRKLLRETENVLKRLQRGVYNILCSEMDNGRNTIIRSVLMIGLVKIKNPYQDMYRSPNSLRLRGARNT